MRTNTVRIEPLNELVRPRSTLSSVPLAKKNPAAESGVPATDVLIIHDEHLRDQLEQVLGFRPYAFGS